MKFGRAADVEEVKNVAAHEPAAAGATRPRSRCSTHGSWVIGAAKGGAGGLELAELGPHGVGGAREHRLEDLMHLLVQLARLRAQIDERYVGHATSPALAVTNSEPAWPQVQRKPPGSLRVRAAR